MKLHMQYPTLLVVIGLLSACGQDHRRPSSSAGSGGSTGTAAGGTDSISGVGGFVFGTGPGMIGSGATFNTGGGTAELDAGSKNTSENLNQFLVQDASYPDVQFPFDPARIVPDACVTVSAQAGERKRPMDIIIAIDNSSSMNSEIEEVQERINLDFYQILEASEIDYRVIMVSRYGHVNTSVGDSNNPVHISPPLGGSTCAQLAPNDPCEPLVVPSHQKFFHYSADIESRDMWQKLLGGLFTGDELESSNSIRDNADQFFPWVQQAPSGYTEFLRPDSFKVIVAITDDGIVGNEFSGLQSGVTWDFDTTSGGADHQAEALEFDTAIRELAPEHFGASSEPRNYKYYAIVGLSTPGAETLDKDQPVSNVACSNDGNSVSTTGRGHQHLAILTDGLRYSSCRTSNYDPIFTAIAQGVVEGSRLPCEFDFPEAPGGQLIDSETLVVTWDSTTGTQPIEVVDTCTTEGFRFDFELPGGGTSSEPQRILLCQASCDAVQADASSTLSVDFGCIGQ